MYEEGKWIQKYKYRRNIFRFRIIFIKSKSRISIITIDISDFLFSDFYKQ